MTAAQQIQALFNAQPAAPKVFRVDGAEYSLAEMLKANADDEAFCEWLETAAIGERFPALMPCRRVQ